ncbi:Na+/H+ antiporter NhaA [Lacisediminihabitans changchengi]|uniref:Na(+)/H(+) antiporter NhaA n=1 Tax=Lacisediminihabitans changchengi TaxID=2787634 RepID=A0A934SMJ5_9MICO|nr:Na+/H+ antiporter NhaA [Lacisediminihabitans changchengi]MBK4346746.1 Na+/H+ antiporter NhaA [Lacisediminihabitans changchengi]MBK4348131.1 Na+/H+ antiporter NhaA [Lacisediminihabitans changchengi]
MSIMRSERVAAVLLLIAAVLGLIAANSPLGAGLMAIQHAHLSIPGTPVDLSVGHWISDGLLAVFFFVVAIELKNELTVGQLNSVSKAVRPAIAAIGGVLVPALIYLAVTAGSGYSGGWPIPTATDIAFALGVLAVFGKGIPSRLRIFILALAILDDIVAILIIALFFTKDPNLLFLAIAVVGVAVFALLSRLLGTRMRVPVTIAMVPVALLTWFLVYESGVHATIAGVALGLAMLRKPGMRVRHALEPITNGGILPLFAFSAALVAIPQVTIGELKAPFWGILIALPVGKLIGIGLGGWLSSFVGAKGNRPQLTFQGLVTAGALGGVGFTVSLLMNELAFARRPEVADEGTLAVLLGSAISIVLAGILVSRLAAYYRRLAALRHDAERRLSAP